MAAILKNKVYHDIVDIMAILYAKNCVEICLFVTITAQNDFLGSHFVTTKMAAISENKAYHGVVEIKAILYAKNCIKIRLFVATTARSVFLRRPFCK